MPLRSSRLALLLICPCLLAGTGAGGWVRVLESAGLDADERIHVLGPNGERAAEGWARRVEQGAFLILEGQSAVASAFGFRPGPKRQRVRSVTDEHNPRLPIVWEREIELPVFELPPETHVFARERWEGAPLVAGLRKGKGAVLWTAAPPGEDGYERFPYLVHALAGLGLEPPVQSRRLWAFFDSSYRMRVDLSYFARRWRASGIAALHVAAWHYFEPDPSRDEYLRTLVRECHKNGILVYAWLELPHVSEKFWLDHPEWREKTALLQDAHLDWRRLMNLANPNCRRAAAQGVRGLIERFDWDGLNLAELYFESLEGSANPARFTPMNDDVRREFREVGGFDPFDLFQPGHPANPGRLRAFLEYRVALARRIETEWVQEIEAVRKTRPGLDLVLTRVDDLFDPAMRDAIGSDAAGVLESVNRRDLTLMVEDPATVWHLGPQRYPEIASRYQRLTPRPERLAVDINVVERYQDVYPTKQQTGTELFQLVRFASRAFARVALYFENSIRPCDWPFLPAASAPPARILPPRESRMRVELSAPAGIRWPGPARVNGNAWPATDGTILWLPAGKHEIAPSASEAALRLLDLNGDLIAAAVVPGGLEFSYTSQARALAVLDHPPGRIEIDGAPGRSALAGPSTLLLPQGRHRVKAFRD